MRVAQAVADSRARNEWVEIKTLTRSKRDNKERRFPNRRQGEPNPSGSINDHEIARRVRGRPASAVRLRNLVGVREKYCAIGKQRDGKREERLIEPAPANREQRHDEVDREQHADVARQRFETAPGERKKQADRGINQVAGAQLQEQTSNDQDECGDNDRLVERDVRRGKIQG